MLVPNNPVRLLVLMVVWAFLLGSTDVLADQQNPTQPRLSLVTGNHQTTIIASKTPVPLVVLVQDQHGRPMPRIKVSFKTSIGKTSPMAFVSVSDTHGLARFHPTVDDFGAIHIKAQLVNQPQTAILFNLVATGFISTIAGEGFAAWSGDHGPATHAQLNAPFGLTVKDNQLLVVDYFNHAVRSIDLQSGIIRPLIGTAKQGFNGDGLDPLKTLVNGPFGLALGPNGALVFSDYYNHRIRQLDPKAGVITTLAGIGTPGYTGDNGLGVMAQIDVPLDIATDAEGNIYLSDWHHHVVRQLDPTTGVIKTIAGVGRPGYNGEGQAARAALSVPLGLATDHHGNIYIADYGNARIRKVDIQTGKISTVAGVGRPGYSGNGGPATSAHLKRPYNVYVDSNGGLFISDAGNHQIRHVEPTAGIITTIAGRKKPTGRKKPINAASGSALAIETDLLGPFSVTRDAAGNLYIAEYFGHTIRKVGAERAVLPDKETTIIKLRRQARQIFGEFPKDAHTHNRPHSSARVASARVALGKKLFHDPRLSLDNTVSCASCHPLDRWGMDGLKVAVGINAQLNDRNTPSVYNAALQDSLFWDGRAKDVESQATEPIRHPKEMGMPSEAAVVSRLLKIPEYQPLFAKAFPKQSNPIRFSNIGTAIGAFERTLLTPDAPFDRFMAGDDQALSKQQLKGLAVYLREGCASCHAGPLMGGQDIHLLRQYPKTAAGDRFEFRKQLGNAYKFKVAPLRNIAQTAPYLHDGRYPTLEAALGDRLAAYLVRETGIYDHVSLAPSELTALIVYLESLTGKIPK